MNLKQRLRELPYHKLKDPKYADAIFLVLTNTPVVYSAPGKEEIEGRARTYFFSQRQVAKELSSILGENYTEYLGAEDLSRGEDAKIDLEEIGIFTRERKF